MHEKLFFISSKGDENIMDGWIEWREACQEKNILKTT